MKKSVFVLAALVMLGGCDYALFDDDIRKEVRSHLKDPDSAKFGDMLVYKERACIDVNSKNSYGGYTGMSAYHLEHRSYGWVSQSRIKKACSLDDLKKLQASMEKNKELSQEKESDLVKALVQSGELPEGTRSLYQQDIKTPCLEKAKSVLAAYDNSLRNEMIGAFEDNVEWDVKRLHEQMEFYSGNCVKT